MMAIDLKFHGAQLISGAAAADLGKVLENGASKHGERDWETGFYFSQNIKSLLRHILKFANGENDDEESGLPHMAHAMCRCMFAVHWGQDKGLPGGYDDRSMHAKDYEFLKGTLTYLGMWDKHKGEIRK